MILLLISKTVLVITLKKLMVGKNCNLQIIIHKALTNGVKQIMNIQNLAAVRKLLKNFFNPFLLLRVLHTKIIGKRIVGLSL